MTTGVKTQMRPPWGAVPPAVDRAPETLEEGDELIAGRRHMHSICSCCVFRQASWPAPRGGHLALARNRVRITPGAPPVDSLPEDRGGDCFDALVARRTFGLELVRG